jgi:hypothetical protein
VTSLPRRLPQHGPVKERWRLHHERSRREVFSRCQGRCENAECPQDATDWSHLFGRGRTIISEPWASSASLTAGLCRGCHQSIDRELNPDLRDRLRLLGLVRLCAEEAVPLSLLNGEDDPVDLCRDVERWLVARDGVAS